MGEKKGSELFIVAGPWFLRFGWVFSGTAAGGEKGRLYGQKHENVAVNTSKPPLPPGVRGGGHGGSHGYLMSEFVDAILRDRKPLVDVTQALNMTVAGIVAHQSALKDGELLKIPQYASGSDEAGIG